MKKYVVRFCLILLWAGFGACQTGGDSAKQASTQPADSLPTSLATETPAKHSPGVQVHLDQLKEEWSAVPNPLVAKFAGSEFGDYFHLTFEDAQGRMYDFGDGKNNLGQMVLYDADFISNPAHVGKEFRISWDWKKSSFYCCEGEMNTVEAQVPSIVGIEAVGQGK